MTNPIVTAGVQVGKLAASQVLDVGKEALAASREHQTPFQYELKRKAADRVRNARDEARAIGAYLGRRPARLATLVLSGAVMVTAFLVVRSSRA